MGTTSGSSSRAIRYNGSRTVAGASHGRTSAFVRTADTATATMQPLAASPQPAQRSSSPVGIQDDFDHLLDDRRGAGGDDTPEAYAPPHSTGGPCPGDKPAAVAPAAMGAGRLQWPVRSDQDRQELAHQEPAQDAPQQIVSRQSAAGAAVRDTDTALLQAAVAASTTHASSDTQQVLMQRLQRAVMPCHAHRHIA
jgi:hypothetical protein